MAISIDSNICSFTQNADKNTKVSFDINYIVCWKSLECRTMVRSSPGSFQQFLTFFHHLQNLHLDLCMKSM